MKLIKKNGKGMSVEDILSMRKHIQFLSELAVSFLSKLNLKNKEYKSVVDQLKAIPINNTYLADRYDTDDKIMLHVWKDGESWDIQIDKSIRIV